MNSVVSLCGAEMAANETVKWQVTDDDGAGNGKRRGWMLSLSPEHSYIPQGQPPYITFTMSFLTLIFQLKIPESLSIIATTPPPSKTSAVWLCVTHLLCVL